MASQQSIWFHLGHALERARQTAPRPTRIEGLAERTDGGGRRAPAERAVPPIPSSDELVATGIALVVDRALAAWRGRRRPGFASLVRAGAAGGAATVLVDLLRPLFDRNAETPTLDQAMTDRILAGVGQGLVYGAVIEPRVPGHPLMKGAVYGSVEYWAFPLGGLAGLLGSHTPQHKLPVVGGLLHAPDGPGRDYVHHIAFGIALALIYGPSPSSNGIRREKE